jgi:hypothetical protein
VQQDVVEGSIPEMKHYCVAVIYYAAKAFQFADPLRSLKGLYISRQHDFRLAKDIGQIVLFSSLRETLWLGICFEIFQPHLLKDLLQDGLMRVDDWRAGEVDGVATGRGEHERVDLLGDSVSSLVIVLIGECKKSFLPRKH